VLVITSNRDGMGRAVLEAFDSPGDAVIGRRCEAPQVPDRCYFCFDPQATPDQLFGQHRAAVAYAEDREGLRHGLCACCAQDATVLDLLPVLSMVLVPLTDVLLPPQSMAYPLDLPRILTISEHCPHHA